jgi:ABC-type molybdate transport system permease subunit
MLTSADFETLRLTFQVASLATIFMLLFGTPLAWWLARTQSKYKGIINAIVALPLVLPPTVLGFYLLVILGKNGPIGQITTQLGLGTLPFTFAGLVVLMVGGNIPDKTRVVSVQIYNHVEALEYSEAHSLAGGLLAFSFCVLWILYSIVKTPSSLQLHK